jgi:hypothetical protein
MPGLVWKVHQITGKRQKYLEHQSQYMEVIGPFGTTQNNQIQCRDVVVCFDHLGYHKLWVFEAGLCYFSGNWGDEFHHPLAAGFWAATVSLRSLRLEELLAADVLEDRGNSLSSAWMFGPDGPVCSISPSPLRYNLLQWWLKRPILPWITWLLGNGEIPCGVPCGFWVFGPAGSIDILYQWRRMKISRKIMGGGSKTSRLICLVRVVSYRMAVWHKQNPGFRKLA